MRFIFFVLVLFAVILFVQWAGARLEEALGNAYAGDILFMVTAAIIGYGLLKPERKRR